MYHASSHMMNIYHFKVAKLYVYFNNREYTVPTQSGRKNI